MSDEIARAFLARLWELQAAAGISNVDLARQLHVTPSYVSRLKRGERSGSAISLALALRACTVYPELRFFLSSDVPASVECVPGRTEEGQQ
jgi:transcriptional regulator with XRE-family HTH domain